MSAWSRERPELPCIHSQQMKLLLDTCVWGGALKVLKDAGHDVIWTGAWLKDPGDDEILPHARENRQILVTHPGQGFW